MSDEAKRNEIERLGSEASRALFAFEQSLGEPGTSLRVQVYRARIEVNNVRAACRRPRQ